MKKTALLFLGIVGVLFSQAQNALAPTCYVDSQIVNLKKVYFNPDNISSIRIFKDSTIGPRSNGSVYISLKKPMNEFVSLHEAVRNHLSGLLERKLLFIIDGQVIKDTAGIRIDPSFSVSMHAVAVNELPFRCEDPALTNIVIIEMGPRSPVIFPLPAKPRLMIRGSTAAAE